MNLRKELSQLVRAEIHHNIAPVIGWLRMDAKTGHVDNDQSRLNSYDERVERAVEAIVKMIEEKTGVELEPVEEPTVHRLSKDGQVWDYSNHFADILKWIDKIRLEEPHAVIQLDRAPVSEWARWREGV